MRRRWWLLIGAGLGPLLGLALLGAGYAWLRSPGGNAWLEGQARAQAQALVVDGAVELSGLHTDLWSRLAIDRLALVDRAGDPLIVAEGASLTLDPLALWRERLDLGEVRIATLRAELHQGEDGALDLMHLLGLDGPPSDAPWTGLPLDVRAERLTVEGGSVHLSGPDGLIVALDDLSLAGALVAEGPALTVPGLALSGELRGPLAQRVSLTGDLRYNGDEARIAGGTLTVGSSALTLEGGATGLEGTTAVELSLALQRLELQELAPLVHPDLTGALAGNLDLHGPLDQLCAQATLRGLAPTRGTLSAAGHLDAGARQWGLSASLYDLHAVDLLPSLDPAPAVEGEATLEGAGFGWPDDLRVAGTVGAAVDAGQGMRLDRSDLDLTLEGGVLTLREGSVVRHPAGAVGLTGTADLVRGPADLHLDGALRLAPLAALGLPPMAGRGSLSGRVWGDLLALDLRAAGDTSLEGLEVSGAALARLGARWEGRYAEGALSLRGEASARRLEMEGLAVNALGLRALHLQRAADGALDASGELWIQGLDADGQAAVSTLEARFDGAMPAGGALEGAVSAELGRFHLLQLPGTGGTLSLRRGADGLTVGADLRDGERAYLLVDAGLDLARGAAQIGALEISPTPRQRWVLTEPAAFAVRGDRAEGVQVRVEAQGLGAIGVLGDFGLSGPLDGTLAIEGLQLDTLAELFPDQAGDLAGRLDLDLRLQGDAAAPVATLSLAGDRLWLPGLSRWTDLAGTVEARGDRLYPDLSLGVAGSPLATLSGSLPVRIALDRPGLQVDEPVDLHLAVLPGSLERLAWLSAEDLSLPEGRLSGEVVLSGRMGDPDLRLAGVGQVAVEGWDQPARLELRALRRGKAVQWTADLRKGLAPFGRTAGSGTTRLSEVTAWALEGAPAPDLEDLDLYLTRLYASAWLEAVEVEDLLSAAQIQLDAHGTLSGSAIVSGSLWEPRASLGLTVDGLQLSEVHADEAFFRLLPSDQGYQLEARLNTGEGDLRADGLIPLKVDLREPLDRWSDGELDLRISGPGIPLSIASAFDPGLQEVQGLLSVRGHIGGTLAAPEPDLRLRIEDGALAYAPLGLRAEHLDLDLLSRGSTLALSHLRALTEPIAPLQLQAGVGQALGARRQANLFVQGNATLEGYTPAAVRVQVDLAEAWLAGTPELQVLLSGTALMEGTWPALRTRGDLTVHHAFLDADAAAFLEQAPLTLDPRLQIYRGGALATAASKREEPAGPPLYEAFDVQLGIDLGRAARMHVAMPFLDDMGSGGATFTTVDTTARLGGRVQARVRSGTPELLGKVEVLDGTARVALARFEIDEGAVTFAGTDTFNPFIDLSATMPVKGGGEVGMHVTGTPEEPVVSFTSQDYPDPSQVMLILLTGQPPESLSAASAMGSLVEMLGRSALGGASLGQVSYQPDGSMRFGLPIDAKLGVEAEWRPRAKLNENRFSVETEYQIGPSLLLSGTWGTRRSWMDMLWEHRFSGWADEPED
ncbi:MAG: translocation/assembly module TamB domain-containing protein [Deltaproteobacteria bacterium]|nr:translocation/assembly module TamB domain-containing protein [Deltaproteobacteria bacterium]